MRKNGKRYERSEDSIGSFVEEALEEDALETDMITKQKLYDAYKLYCNKYSLVLEAEENLGKVMKGKHSLKDKRLSTGDRKWCWQGLKLRKEYDVNDGQEILIV